jgi:hypothetical protein
MAKRVRRIDPRALETLRDPPNEPGKGPFSAVPLPKAELKSNRRFR